MKSELNQNAKKRNLELSSKNETWRVSMTDSLSLFIQWPMSKEWKTFSFIAISSSFMCSRIVVAPVILPSKQYIPKLNNKFSANI